MAEFVSKSEYARMRGISRQMVGKHGDQGRVVLSPDGKGDVDATDRLINASRDPARGGDRTGKRSQREREAAEEAGIDLGGDGRSELAQARIRELNARAMKAELEAAQLEAKVVEIREVERAAKTAAIQHRDQLMSLIDRMSHELAAESDPAVIHRRLSEEHNKALSDFADLLEREAETIEAEEDT